MKKEEIRIVYMGTPDFAVAPLQLLVEGGYNVVGVVTMPDKPAGRGHKIQYSPVKEYASAQGLPLLQPEKLKAPEFIEDLRALRAHLQIVVAFRMLPEVVWNMPVGGTFNLHASLLPQYRGAAPINWAVINGEKVTGATTFFLTHEIDTGRVILRREISIGETDTAGIVHDRLMKMGALMVLDTVDAILAGTVTPTEQDDLEEGELKIAPKIFKETCRIDWGRTADDVYNHIRGLSPYPAAWTLLCIPHGEPVSLKIFEAEKREVYLNATPGSIVTDGKTFIDVACGDGCLRLKSVQLPGKKRMAVLDMLNGFAVTSIHLFR